MKRKLLTSVGCVSMIAILFLIYNVNFSGGGFFQSTGLPYETKVDEELDKNEIPVYDYCYYDLTEDGTILQIPNLNLINSFRRRKKLRY